MNRYASAVERIVQRITYETAGVGIVVVPPGQHGLIAEALAATLPGVTTGPLTGEALRAEFTPFLVAGLPQDKAEAAKALSELNDRRDWLSARGRLLILLLSRTELAELQQRAGDVYSVRLFIESVAFIPDPTVDESEARAALARWHLERFGRLDLRGFVRNETEDVSWSIEDIYQDLKGTIRAAPEEAQEVFLEKDIPLVFLITSFRTPGRHVTYNHPVVVLGHPGSGKTFFLRWVALNASKANEVFGIQRPIPLLTSLSAYAQTPGPISLYDYFSEGLLEGNQAAAHCLDRATSEQRAIFLLDGLDEVGDEPARRRMVAAIHELGRRAPGCLMVATSRIAGYASNSLERALQLMLVPFDNEAIGRFLVRWCELYARDRLGESPRAREEGKAEGARLAEDVLQHKDVCELARNPLLLTVLAIVHRAGVRLPDHRVELYEHATRVLVERWNRVRSLSSTVPAPPLKVADAVRLLGPVALETVRSGARGAIAEGDLRRMLERSLVSGNLRGLTSAEEAVNLFKNSLGLLIEQGPGLYAFLHLTLVEYFAAREIVRTNELERLAANPMEAYQAQWREILLLAAGELGVNRADDARLAALIDMLLESAGRRPGRPSTTVPSLLGGLLADDPGLSASSATSLIDTLVPTWWFTRAYGGGESLDLVVTEAFWLITNRIQDGRFMEELRGKLEGTYGNGIEPKVLANLVRGGWRPVIHFLQFLYMADVDHGPAYLACLKEYPDLLKPMEAFLHPGRVEHREGNVTVWTVVSRHLDQLARQGVLSLDLRVVFYLSSSESSGNVFVIPWSQTRYDGSHGRAWASIEATLPPEALILISGAAEVSVLTAPVVSRPPDAP